jgi:hypothetical protein
MMKNMKMLVVAMFLLGALPLAMAADAAPPRVAPADAKNHVGEAVTVCGKVVNAQIAKYGLKGHGKPVTFDLDQAEPNRVFYFLAFGTEAGGPEEAIAAYQGKQVCVTGKITMPQPPPYMLIVDRAQIKIQPNAK